MQKRAKTRLLALKDIKGYGNKRILDMITTCGSIDIAFNYSLEKSLINEESLSKYEDAIELCENNNINILTYFDEKYPQNLRKIGSPPLILFYRGNIDLLKMPSVSIVGTRSPSDNTSHWVYETSRKIADLGFVVISGGALGVDACTHRGVLDSTGKTICVLGSGLTNIYPKQNQELITRISQNGLVITECLPSQNVNKFSLLERNRITSGLGDKVLIVATGLAGGTMSQYKVAVSQKKKIFCPSPSLQLEPSDGVKKIIQDNEEVYVIKYIKEILEPKNKIHKNESMNQRVINSFV